MAAKVTFSAHKKIPREINLLQGSLHQFIKKRNFAEKNQRKGGLIGPGGKKTPTKR
jgi:hypothetical protein